MEIVSRHRSNPFGMDPPCRHPCTEGVPAVFAYGDPNADFHLIGDHPGVHGGRETGIPFTGTDDAKRLLSTLAAADVVQLENGVPIDRRTFMSYLHMCCVPYGETPTPADYAELERFFDAELRAVAAHVLLPVGERAIGHVLRHFTAIAPEAVDVPSLHAQELAGSGFIVVPIADPAAWSDGDRQALLDTLAAIVDSDYHQEADLTRFSPTSERYLVR